jgi:hypothetical protein
MRTATTLSYFEAAEIGAAGAHGRRNREAALCAAGGDLLPAADRLPHDVANLLVARGGTAQRAGYPHRTERGWLRLIRERLIKCLMLSVAGGALGLLLAFVALHWLMQTRHDMSRVESIHIDGVVVAFTVGGIVLCALFQDSSLRSAPATSAFSARSIRHRAQ